MAREARQAALNSGDIDIPIDDLHIAGTLRVPPGAQAMIVFAHGSGSSRFSPRNRFVADTLAKAGFATLLLDLLSPEEERQDRVTARLRFDVDMLAERVVATTDWLSTVPELRWMPIGYFGASTGAAAALIAAARRPSSVGAVVSRGGRPDLAGDALAAEQAPTLLIVGSRDFGIIEVNEKALWALATPQKELSLIPGATHLFEEPGALEQVARLATAWFQQYLVEPRAAPRLGAEPP
jgi:putative phosphoribosyl transferase